MESSISSSSSPLPPFCFRGPNQEISVFTSRINAQVVEELKKKIEEVKLYQLYTVPVTITQWGAPISENILQITPRTPGIQSIDIAHFLNEVLKLEKIKAVLKDLPSIPRSNL
jgi:hypothetical protein